MKNSLFSEVKIASAGWRVLFVVALLLAQCSLPAFAEGLQIIHHTMPAALTNATKVRESLRTEKINFSVGLPLRNPEGLTNLLRDIYDPGSPNFHHFLTPEQFTEQFGPAKEDYEAVAKFLHEQGLTVIQKHSSRMVLGVKGTVGSIQRAFHVKLNEYQHPYESRTFRAPDKEPTLDLAVRVESIGGLDTYQLAKPCLKPLASDTNAAPQAGSGAGGTYFGKDFRAAYVPGVTNTGAGQSVGLLEFSSGFYQADINSYVNAAGIPNVPVTTVLLDGYTGGPGSGNDEVSLDIEMAIAMAPGLSNVIVYEGSTTDDILAAMAAGPCKTLSASWTFTTDATTENIFLQFAAQGQSYFNASGDSDAYVGAPPAPDSDVNITVVGGTTLSTTGPAGSWTGEVVWNSSTTQPLGTGGGISTTVAIPSWQQGISMAANGGSTTFRNIPDVAMVANNIAVIYGNGSSNSFVGTSCATPLWAAFVALVNQTAAVNNQPTVGFLNPLFYSIGKGSNSLSYAAGFHDITSGNNEWTSSPSKYVGATGYDLCTGWGSPTGSNLLNALALQEPLHVLPSPVAGAVFNGPAGGPFSPLAKTYTLTNAGTTTFSWALSTPPPWLDVSLSSGTLTPGGASASVILSVDPSATNYVYGSYPTNLYITNTTDLNVQTLPITLAIVTPPVISVQPTNIAVLIGQPAGFTVVPATNSYISYQWYSNGVVLVDSGNVTGSTTPTLSFGAVTASYATTYSVILSNNAGTVTSSNAALSITPSAPVFVVQPTNVNVLPGGYTFFSVAVVGNTPVRYQWQFNGVNLTANAAKYSGGVTNAVLNVLNCVAANVGNYTCVASNSLGTNVSSAATLSLIPTTTAGYTLTSPGSFSATTTQPENPYSGLVYVPSQSAYFGSAYQGGANGGGATYKVTSAGTITREHSFAGGTDGAFPVAPLMLGKDGELYGASYNYGTYNYGALWKAVVTSTAVTALIQFNQDNGSTPISGLMQAADNFLYGACNSGGTYGYGTIFKTATNGTAVTNLISFDDFNGAFPSPILVQGPDGYLYGTAENGGTNGTDAGTIYKISTNGTFTLLHSFNGTNDGAVPIAGLTLGTDGNYYGTTLQGGASNWGTVFKMTSAGALTTLYSFTNGADGAEPWGGLIQTSNGNFYGTTQQGGSYGGGTVFAFAPNGPVLIIGQLDGFQGDTSEGNLVQGPDGNLYGVTFQGGQSGFGAFFSISNSGPLQITGQPANQTVYAGASALFTVATSGGAPTLYQWFQNGTNLLANGAGISGATGNTLVISNTTLASAALYSVIVSNSLGSVTSSAASLTVLTSGPVIVSQPAGQTALVGSIALFSVSATGNAPLLYQWQFNGTNLTDGTGISGSATSLLTLTNLSLASAGNYSVIVSNATAGVTSSNAPLVVVPTTSVSVSYTNLHSFTGGTTDGTGPSSTLIQGLDGYLYGTTGSGGSTFFGDIFRCTLGGKLTNLYSFTGTPTAGPNGAYAYGGLTQTPNGNLYGMTQNGGTNGLGTAYRMTNFATVTFIHTFAGPTDGSGMDDSFTLGSDGNMYGTGYNGGTYGNGSVFKMAPATGNVTLLYSFTGGADGSHPVAGLVQGSDGSYYGGTVAGGSNGLGTLFKVTSSGTFTTLVTFNYTNGSKPFGGLVQGKDGNYYGTTAQGGAYGYGTVFQVSSNGTLNTLLSFAGTNGGFPGASLIQDASGFLYGTTEGNGSTAGGGLGGQGTAFRVTTNGALTTLLWFDGYNGAEPQGALLLANDGNLYGTTTLGGTGFNPTTGGGLGTLFQIVLPKLVTNSFTASNAIAALPYTGTLLRTVTPPAGDVYTYSLVSGPSWLTVATNGALSGSPTNGNIGTNTFVISVTDSSGFFASTNLSLVVIADPAPTFFTNSIVEPWANAGTPYSVSIASSATAPYLSLGDVITFAEVSGPAWASVSSSGTISGTPSDTDGGTNVIVVSATDLGGSSNTASVIVYVNPHPVFTNGVLSYPMTTVGFSYGGSLASTVIDPSVALGDSLSFSVLSGPAWLSVAPNGALSGTPGGGVVGTNIFTVQVADTNGLTASASLVVVVNADNPPVFAASPFSLPLALAGAPYSGTIATNASDPDVGDTLTFAKISGPAWLSVAPNGTISGTPGDSDGGLDTFLVSVTDYDGLSTNATMTVYVDAHPVFSSSILSYVSGIVGLPYSGTLASNVTDATLPMGDVLSYSKVSGPAWLTVGTNGAISGTPTPGDQGPDSFAVQVVDSYGLAASATLDITINSNAPPTFILNPLTTLALASNFFSLDISTNAVETNAGDSLTFALVSGPAWLTNSTTNGTFSGTPADSDGGTNMIVISATDLAGYSNTLSLVVFVDAHPVFSSAEIYYAPAPYGAPYSGTLVTNVTDPTLVPTNTLAYSLVAGPSWLSISNDGTLSGTPTISDLGSNVFTVAATDSYGLSATAYIEINITSSAPPTPPMFILDPLTGPGATAGASYSLDISTNTIPSSMGDTLTFSVVSGPAWLTMATNGLLSGTPYSINGGSNTFVVSALDLTSSLSVTGTVYVFVTATPITETVTAQGTNLLLSWTGGVPPYQVQITTSAFPAAWTNYGGPTNVMSLLISPTNDAGYFRVLGQ